MGEYDTSKNGPTVDVDVIRAKKHERFNRATLLNDIAILYLKHDVIFNANVKPVCLLLDPPLSERNLVGLNPFVVGWWIFFLKQMAEIETILNKHFYNS